MFTNMKALNMRALLAGNGINTESETVSWPLRATISALSPEDH